MSSLATAHACGYPAPMPEPHHAPAADPQDHWLVRLGMGLNRSFARYFHNLIVESPCPIPPAGPGILVCNHLSGLDPALLQAACPRLITWMMASEYYRQPGVHWICQFIEAIPLERGGRDLAGTRAALRALDRGRLLGIFPEGRIEPTRQLLPFQTGVAMLAIHARAPVFPAYLEGTQRNKPMLQAYLTPNTARLAFGAPLTLSTQDKSREALEAATERIRSAMDRLRMRKPG